MVAVVLTAVEVAGIGLDRANRYGHKGAGFAELRGFRECAWQGVPSPCHAVHVRGADYRTERTATLAWLSVKTKVPPFT